MKMKYLLPAVAVVGFTLEACSNKAAEGQGAGIDPRNMDKSVAPGDDFYEFACGGWIKDNPLKPEYARYGTFEALIENNEKQIQGLIEEIAAAQQAEGSLEQKIAAMYNSVMDSTAQNNEGITPVAGRIDSIMSMKDKQQLFRYAAATYKDGIPNLFGFYIGADVKDSKNNLLQIYQSGLTLGQRDYYLDQDEATVRIREEYKKYIADLFQMAGFSEADAARYRDDVMRIETRMAEKSYSATLLRDPAANYHPMAYADLQKDYAAIDWDTYFKEVGVGNVEKLSVGQPEPLLEAGKIWQEESLEALKGYCVWTLIDAAAPYLSDSLRGRSFDFYGKVMSGKEEQQPRWKRAVAAVNGALGQAVGRMYVQKYFPEAAKHRMQTLVANLQTALGERIREQEWMSEETKARAIEKLDAFRVKVGYPDKWRDYSSLIIGGNYWENVVNSNRFAIAEMIREKMNKPVDPEEWFMDPQTVNAYYNPTTNEICFPAGILQYPFFDMAADDAFNYGAIGVVIGHEMTHGFDDKGRQFDKDGNLRDWWGEGDGERFEARAKVMEEFFNGIEVLPGLHANGQLTLGENLADHGGLMVAYQAFRNATAGEEPVEKEGFTPEQRFFLAYANVWADNIRDEEIRQLTKVDPHSLGRWRVNGALPHIDAWYDAFGITESDSLYIPKAERVAIW